MQLRKHQAEEHLYYCVDEHRAEVFRFVMDDESFENKLKFVDEFLKSSHAKFKKYTKKRVLLDFSKSDDEIKKYYKSLDNRGGSREGSGRKIGSYANGVKSDRTEQFTMAINKEEKDFLIACLEWYRITKQQNPDLINYLMSQYEAGGVITWINPPQPLGDSLREIKK